MPALQAATERPVTGLGRIVSASDEISRAELRPAQQVHDKSDFSCKAAPVGFAQEVDSAHKGAGLHKRLTGV